MDEPTNGQTDGWREPNWQDPAKRSVSNKETYIYGCVLGLYIETNQQLLPHNDSK